MTRLPDEPAGFHGGVRVVERITGEMREAGAVGIWEAYPEPLASIEALPDQGRPGRHQLRDMANSAYHAMFALDPEVVEMRSEIAALRPVVEALKAELKGLRSVAWIVEVWEITPSHTNARLVAEAVRAWREQKR